MGHKDYKMVKKRQNGLEINVNIYAFTVLNAYGNKKSLYNFTKTKSKQNNNKTTKKTQQYPPPQKKFSFPPLILFSKNKQR